MRFESEGALNVLFAENGTKQQLLATLDSMRHEALDDVARVVAALEFVMTKGPPYPDRIHQSVLIHDLVLRINTAVIEWADDAEQRVEGWPDLKPDDATAKPPSPSCTNSTSVPRQSQRDTSTPGQRAACSPSRSGRRGWRCQPSSSVRRRFVSHVRWWSALLSWYRPLVEQLDDYSTLVYRRHLRRPEGGTYRPLNVAEDAAVCARLMDHVGWSTAHIVGHSYGALVALQLALDAPGRVGSIALLEPAARGKSRAPHRAGGRAPPDGPKPNCRRSRPHRLPQPTPPPQPRSDPHVGVADLQSQSPGLECGDGDLARPAIGTMG